MRQDCIRFTSQKLTLFLAANTVIHCGRYGLFVWPMSFVADTAVADMAVGDRVQTHVIHQICQILDSLQFL